MTRYVSVLAAIAALVALPVCAQNRMDFTVATTTGDGDLTTTITWAPRAGVPDPTSCTASGASQWAGPKAARGSETITFASSATLNLECTWQGDSIVTFTWQNPTQNTDGSPYTDAAIVRLKATFGAALSAGPNCNVDEICADAPQSPARTMQTITGINQTGTLLGVAYAINQRGVASDPSNAATKTFTGAFTVTESVGIVVNPKPGPVSGLSLT